MTIEAATMRALRSPERIAVVGASRDPTKPSGRPIKFLRRYGYRGEIIPISEAAKDVQGFVAYPSLDAAPPAELAIVCRPAAEVSPALEECARLGVRAAVVFAAGFAEVGGDGEERQQDMLAHARKHGGQMRVLGPNCLGFAHLGEGVMGTFSSALERTAPLPGGGALVTQSGGFGALLYSAATAAGVGFSWLMTTGNESDLAVPELMQALIEEDDVEYLLVYLERIRDGATLLRGFARALELGKPIVAFLAGRTERGARAALSHTGSLTDTSGVYADVFGSQGAIVVSSIEEMMDAARALQAKRWAAGNRATIVTASGGAGVVLTDACESNGVRLADWEPEWQARLRTGLPRYASVVNPIDTTASPGLAAIEHALRTAAEHPGTDLLLPMMEHERPDESERIACLSRVQAGTDKPVVVAWTGGGPHILTRLAESGLLGYTDPSRAARAASVLARAGALRSPGAKELGARRIRSRPDRPIRTLPEPGWQARADGRAVLRTELATELLREYGVRLPRQALVTDVDAAVAFAERVGAPIALKLDSPEVAHRARVGGVRLGLSGADEIRRAFAELDAIEVAQSRVIAQEMVSHEVELFVGMKLDAELGPILVVGTGGGSVELIGDSRALVPPVESEEVVPLLSTLRGVARGPALGAVALDEAARAVAAVSRLVADTYGEFAELDINPLCLTRTGTSGRCVAVDWLFVRRA